MGGGMKVRVELILRGGPLMVELWLQGEGAEHDYWPPTLATRQQWLTTLIDADATGVYQTCTVCDWRMPGRRHLRRHRRAIASKYRI